MELARDIARDAHTGRGGRSIAHGAAHMAATVVNGACGAHGRSWVAAGVIRVSEAQILDQGRERHDVWCYCTLYTAEWIAREV